MKISIGLGEEISVSPTEECVLIVLDTVEKSYGWEIIQILNEPDVAVHLITEGTLYYLLSSMKKKQLIKEVDTKKKPRTEGNNRKYYSISQKGEKALQLIEKYRTALRSIKKSPTKTVGDN